MLIFILDKSCIYTKYQRRSLPFKIFLKGNYSLALPPPQLTSMNAGINAF